MFSLTLTHGNSKNEIRTNEESKKRGVSMEKSKAGTKKIIPDGLSLPDHNAIIINIIRLYGIRCGKSRMKFI